jgi:hypothetical protein
MTENVLTLLDRFTLTTEEGHPDVYTRWVPVPDWCQRAEFRLECLAWQGVPIYCTLESSMDQVSKVNISEINLGDVEVRRENITSGLGRFVRLKMSAQAVGTKPNMMISAFLFLRTAT